MATKDVHTKESEEADRMLEEYIGGLEETEEQPTEEDDAPATSEGTFEEDKDDSGFEDSSVDEGSETEEKSDSEDSKEKIEQKYKSLQGNYNWAIKNMRELQKQLDQTQQEKEELKTASPAEKPSEETSEDVELLRQFKEQYGDWHRVFTKLIQDTIASEVPAMIARELPKVEEKFNKQAVAQFEAEVKKAIPKISEYNGDPAFNEWLQKQDRFSGKTYYDLLVDAHQNMDLDRFVEIYKAYWKKDLQQPDQGQKGEKKRPTTPRDEGGGSSPESKAGKGVKKTYKRAEWEKALSLATTPSSNPATQTERKRTEAELINAMNEGRVQN